MNRNPLRVLAALFRPYAGRMTWIFLATLLVSLLEGLNIAAFLPLLSAMLESPSTGNWSAPLRALLVFCERWGGDPLQAALALLLGVTVVKCIVVLWRDALVARASGNVQYDLKNRLLQRYAESPYSFFQDRKQGELIYQVSTAANRAGVLVQKIPQMVSEFLLTVVLGVLLWVTLPWAALSVFVLGAAYHAFTRFLSGRVSYHTGKGRVEAGAAQNSLTNEFLTGIRQIMAYGTQAGWLAKFREQSRIFRDLFVRDSIWLSIPKVLLELSAVAFLCAALWTVRLFHPETVRDQLALFGVFALGLVKLLPSLTLLGHLRMELSGLMADVEMIEPVLASSLRAPAGGPIRFSSLEKGISLEGIGFSYPGRPSVLRAIDLEIPRGGVTAIVGPSGSGKSTLAYLLLSLMEPSEGRIRVDGLDFKQLCLRDWRDRVGFVPQEMFIFHATVAENITFGREGFTPERIRRAAETANADPFICQLPQGYDTVVGERGTKLSGGQQQRIAIARAVLSDPEILILDEATSFLDSESERLVQEAIERVSRDRTVILIAHRLTTVQRASQIVVLEKGHIVERGRHQELLQDRGRYYDLFASAGLGSDLP